jgi:hypothetical protein
MNPKCEQGRKSEHGQCNEEAIVILNWTEYDYARSEDIDFSAFTCETCLGNIIRYAPDYYRITKIEPLKLERQNK